MFSDRARKRTQVNPSSLEPGLPAVMGDLDRLQQLFINLVDNAIKYTPAGGTVTLTAARVPTINGIDAVEIAVSDTGPGIPEKDLPRLTERFYRVDKARSRDLGGTGLRPRHRQTHCAGASGRAEDSKALCNKARRCACLLPAAADNGRHHRRFCFCAPATPAAAKWPKASRASWANGTANFSAPAPSRRRFIRWQCASCRKPASISPLNTPKAWTLFRSIAVDRVITLCGDADENCPVFPTSSRASHWPLLDPALTHGDEEEILQVFRQVRDDIRARVQELFHHELASTV